MTKDRQYRTFLVETRALGEQLLVTGRALVFDQPAVVWEYDGVQYHEVIAAGALDGCRMDDVVLNVDHQGKPAAKTRNGTLRLEVRADGLYVEADLSRNATGRELYDDIRAGFYDRMSYAFTVDEDGYDKATRTRTIHRIARLWDVSAVTFAAYEQTSISARSWAEAQRELEAAEAAQAAEAARATEVAQLETERLRHQILLKAGR